MANNGTAFQHRPPDTDVPPMACTHNVVQGDSRRELVMVFDKPLKGVLTMRGCCGSGEQLT